MFAQLSVIARLLHKATLLRKNSTTAQPVISQKPTVGGATPWRRVHHRNGAHPVAFHHIHHDRHGAICYVSQPLHRRWGSTLPASVTNILLVNKYDWLCGYLYCPGYHRTSAARPRHGQDVTPTHVREGCQDMRKTPSTYINQLSALADD